MKFTSRPPLLLLIITASLLVLCCAAAVAGRALYLANLDRDFPFTSSNFPRMDGSTSTQPIRMLVACKAVNVPCRWQENYDGQRFLNHASSANRFPDTGGSGTHRAYQNLIKGKTDIILVARMPSADELNQANQAGVELETYPIALDAFIFIANEANPVRSLTPEQARDIYTGKITNWKELGGRDVTIRPYQRDQNSGSQELMEALVLKGQKPVDAPTMIDSTMIASYYNVSNFENALAYSIYYYEENMARRPKVKVLAVNGIAPDSGTIRFRKYPFVTEVYAVVRGNLEEESSARLLLTWLGSEAGQRLIQQSGYVPINPPRFP